jgi:hypothetical protein
METSRRRRSAVLASTARFGIESAVENVSGVLLRAAQFDGPTAVEENPAELVKKLSARHMRIRSISKRFVEGASRPGSTGPATGASINRS